MTCPNCTPATGLCDEHRITPLEWDALAGYLEQQEEEGIERLLRDLDDDE